jgi:hypothetical protein
MKDITSQKELEKLETKFFNSVLDPTKAKGVKYVDSTMNIQQLDVGKQVYSNFAEQKQYASQVYNFLGINEKIINGTASDDEILAYIERNVENFGNKLAEELTYKLFTDKEIGHDNKIVATANGFMNMARRLDVARMAREFGLLNKGQWADLVMLPFEISDDVRKEPLPISQNYIDGANGNKDQTQQDNENKPPTIKGESDGKTDTTTTQPK